MWDYTHLLTLIILFGLMFVLVINRNVLTPYRRSIYMSVGVCLILSRISLDIWYITTGSWNVQTSLPLELCSIASLLSAIMLFTRSKWLFEVLFFIAIGGALQALLTPELAYGFPHFRYVQFFFDHFLLMIAPLLLTLFERYTLTFRSLIRSFFFLNVLALVVAIINLLLNANYMFLMEKPSTRSLLDLLGPHPYYLLAVEGVAFIIFLILYGLYRFFTFYFCNSKL